MPAAKLPKKLHARLDYLAARVRKVRTLRAVGRAAFLLPVAALVAILADAYLGLPEWARLVLLAAWTILLLRELRHLIRARFAAVDLEAVASAVEEEFPRLAERLTTAVELAEHSDESNGSPALMEEVIADADSRARKLDLTAAFPTSGAVASCLTAAVLLGLLLISAFTAPRSGEHLRRFFLPWYTPTKTVHYKVVVTSGDPAVKRGDPVNLTAYVEATKPDADLPTAATLIVTANGKDERLAMTAQDGNVWFARRPAAEGDFDYRVEAGGAVSDTHHVAVVEPITLAAAHVTVKPPAYAATGRDQDAPVEGLGELTALEHSTITFDLRFVPRPTTALLEFTPQGTPDAKPVKEKTFLRPAADGSVKETIPAKVSGTFALSAEGDRGVRSEFPAQPLHVRPDEAPKLPRVTGLGDKPRLVRPTEKIVVEASATDDVAITKLVLEWRIDSGPVQSLPLNTRGLPAPQADGKAVLSLTDKVKVGQKVACRLAATDNRDVPEARLTPQTTYFPANDGWAEFTVDVHADPLAEQDIRGRQAEIDAKLKTIHKELTEEAADAGRRLNPGEAKDLKNRVEDTAGKLDDLARDVSVTPELARLAEALRGLADREMRDADAALARATEDKAPDRPDQLKKAKDALEQALRKVDALRQENDKTARDRLDRRKLEDLAQEQKDLAERAKSADPKKAAELAKKQKEIEEGLNKLREQSEAIKNAADAAKADEAAKLAAEAKRLGEEMKGLNEAMAKAEKNSAQERLAELKKRQEELAKKAKELADRTDTASRVAEAPPLNPEDAARAKEALDKGDLDEAAKQQEKARQELERLARDLEQAAANSRDPREMAKQLARLQEDLRNRVAQETKDQPLDKLPAERRTALETQQEAIERATARIKTPVGDLPATTARQRAVGDAQQARDLLKKGADAGADKKMQEAKESLDQLAEKLPTKEQRLAKARDEVAQLKAQQEAIRQQAEAVAEGAKKQDPDASATQREVAKKLADAARKQAALADQLDKMDAPGQDARQDKAADALQRAAADLTAGRPQDATASQQTAKRELERLEQALSGQMPADEKAAELAKKQRQLADEAAANAQKPDKAAQQDLQKRQAEIARDVEKLQTPEAASAQADAADAARKAAADNQKPDDLARKVKDAADKLDQLHQQVNGQEPPAQAADRLAKKQKANADEQEKRKDNASTGEARKKAAQEAEELKNLRTGQDAQKAKQQAQEALQRAANHLDPQANAKAQREAADALKDLADKLSRNETAKGEPRTEDPAEAADRLAKKQKQLAEQTKREAEQARQQGGDAAKKAAEKASREQKELAKQAGEMPGHDSPKDLQQAQEAMGKAQEELDRENFNGAVQKQKEAADALDRLTRKAQENKQQRAGVDNPGLPSKELAEAARQLAEEQRKLQEEAMKAGEDLAKETAPRKDNPVEELARQQEQIAREAGDLAKKVTDRQGEKADQAKDAKQAADAAKQTSGQVKNGELNGAKESGKQAAQAMDRLAQDKAGGDTGQKAKDLARRQADVNQKLEELAKDAGAGRAQQAARQQQLEDQARDLGQKLGDLAKGAGDPMGKPAESAEGAARSAGKSGDQLKEAREAGRKGQKDQAGEARDQATESMDRAAQQAGEAAKQLAGGEKGSGSPQAGKALDQARGQMSEAGKKLGQGQPGEAGGAMEKAAESLQQAADQLGQGGQPGQDGQKSGPGKDGKNSGGNIGGPGGTLDLRDLSPEVAQYTGKSWGELPGQIKQKIIQEMQAKYGADYARNIKLYFEQLAERK